MDRGGSVERLNHKQQVWMDQRVNDPDSPSWDEGAKRVLPWVWMDRDTRLVACMVQSEGRFHVLYAYAPLPAKEVAA